MPLPGIPSIPGDAPAGIRSWMTGVRNRLLAQGDQLTDAELTSVRTLLRRSSNTPTASVAVDPGPIFLPKPVFFYNARGAIGWTTYDVTSAGVPADASGVVIQGLGVSSGLGATNGVDLFAMLRVDSANGNVPPHWYDTFVLLHGATNSTSLSANGQQGVFPIKSDGTFEYAITGVWDFVTLSIQGYYP